ncbi:MAG: hypothetical protein PHN69_05245 [Candidatus Pacebacteria bacterium]|nr:hypothetical protein [Candidatus Paceibacterota bacterium]
MKNALGFLIVLIGFFVLFSNNITSLFSGHRIIPDQHLDEQQRMQNQQRLFEEEHQRIFNEMQNQQAIDFWALDETIKTGTPVDEGGYMHGYGFNPSDTMAEDANKEQEQLQTQLDQQINDINNANNSNNFGNGMGF